MNVLDYLQQRLTKSASYELTNHDRDVLDSQGLEQYIYGKLMSKKFRKWSVPERVWKKVRDEVVYCVKSKKPLTLMLSYGGFKLWRLPTSPEVDWSEFFYIAYHLAYMASIAAVYEPGVHFDFSSADIAVTAMNNVPRKDVDQYDQSMKTLIAAFTPHLPQNITISASRLRDLFQDEEEFITEGEKLRKTARERFAKDPHYRDEFRRGAIQNVQLAGGTRDLSNVSEEELKEIRERGAEIVEEIYDIPQIINSVEKGTIEVLATKLELDIPMIVTGTTKYSAAKFWAGLGVLARNGDSFAEYVVTPKQWKEIKNNPHEAVETDLINLKNFKQILVYPEKFNFSSKKGK